MPVTKTSFSPISTAAARILILGSMPGERSLQAGQYYAHPQNTFWKVMGQIIGFDPSAPYEQRVAKLNQERIALWDVIRCCERLGSLDGNILQSSVEPNDFASFFKDHPRIELICFNGATAAQCFQRRVLPTLGSLDLAYLRMPSTSPAHTLSLVNKVEAWAAIKTFNQGV